MKRLLTLFLLLFAYNLQATDIIKVGSGWWVSYRQNFGMEKTTVSFPYQPTVTRDSTMTTATAYNGQACYTFTGYFPPIGNIATAAFFDEILGRMSVYPFTVTMHQIYENNCGNWVLEYVAQDSYRNLIIRSFSVVTPFNAYTLQCIHPFGARENYTYFRDSFRIHCECGY